MFDIKDKYVKEFLHYIMEFNSQKMSNSDLMNKFKEFF